MSALGRLGHRTSLGRLLPTAALGALALACLTVGSARAAVPDACGLTTSLQIAKAFGLKEAVVRRSTPAPPGNASGVLRTDCRTFAWSGAKPANSRRKRRALLEGRLAWLTVKTWVTDQGPYAPAWRARFDSERKAVRQASVELFLRRLGGAAFAPPRYEADETIAYRASTARVRRVRALWWKRHEKSMIQLDLEVARGEPALAALKRIAAVVVRRFNTECNPCEGPPAA